MMSDLFHPEPEHWSPRGSLPHRQVWASMRSLLAAEPLPPTREKVARLLADAFRAVVGVDLTQDPIPEASKQVYLLHVTDGDVSSGVVDVTDWKLRLIPLLLSRVGSTKSQP